ncbi:PQQ-dependent sugar dehydrogenase [Urechidicola croceus]|uniref:Glucose/Sorbosone dehydrogenase domain-containing protein n=1 Tax=Urechidicola croceus TaxID=1850246 RepID=A0A1D8P9A9_9FLAO|nr:PQQ-dependent sugar dehydrogenase [Urechidicola croceus]AOW21147.1 hypothetical protein LPB138_10860 [Urechidicola croceus]
MKRKLLVLAGFIFVNFVIAQNPVTDDTLVWDVKYLKSSGSGNAVRLANPYEITFGPDGWLWITERGSDGGSNSGERIIRINPEHGTTASLNDVAPPPPDNPDDPDYLEEIENYRDEYTFTTPKDELIDLSSSVYQAAGQDGLMGMAIHPALYDDIETTTNNYVYVAYTYYSGGRKVRIARLVYNYSATNPSLTVDTTLGSNGALIEGIPGSNDHNSGRLKIGPDMKLYYTIGDQGANQFDNACSEILAQFIPSQAEVDAEDYSLYPGKLIRMNLDGTIPSDNPTFDHDDDGGTFTPEVQSHIYTIGHRNHQGIIFDRLGNLYNSEHGPKVDDEINKIIAGGNYGWPQIAGYYDDESYSYCNWSHASGGCPSGWQNTDHSCVSGAPSYTEDSGTPLNFQPPIGTYGSSFDSTLPVENFTDNDPDAGPAGGWLTWPTVAPSSIDIYEEGLYPTAAIPGWNNSLLITTLKEGTIFRAKLNSDRTDIEGDDNKFDRGGYEEFHSSVDRYRDIAIDPTDGLTFYAIMDSSGTTSGPSGTSDAGALHHPGRIAKISFIGGTVLANTSQSESKFSVYPNPAKDILNIYNPNNTEYSYKIVNLLGKVVLSNNEISRENTNRLDISSLNSGIYIINIQSVERNYTQKLIIE